MIIELKANIDLKKNCRYLYTNHNEATSTKYLNFVNVLNFFIQIIHVNDLTLMAIHDNGLMLIA